MQVTCALAAASCYALLSRDQGFSPDGTLRAKPCFYFDRRYLRQLRHLLQGILRNDKHQVRVNISCEEKTLHFKEAPLENEHCRKELGGCFGGFSNTLGYWSAHGRDKSHRHCVAGNISLLVEVEIQPGKSFNATGNQHTLEAHLLRPHGHSQRPLSVVFFQTDPQNPLFLLLTTEAEGIPLDH